MSKYKKNKKLFESYKGTVIDKGVKEELKRMEKRYNKQRSRSTK